MSERHFVTSTGTEIGKTIVSCLLLKNLRTRYDSIGYWKPVASGCEESSYGYRSPDEVEVLNQTELTPDDVHATDRFEAPLSPDKAAEREGRTIEPGPVLEEWTHLRDEYRALVVEGIGGVAVPFTPNYDVADLARDLDIPVLLVVESRLGTISHTRTAQYYLQNYNSSASAILLTPSTGEPIEETNREHLRNFYPDRFVELLPELEDTPDEALGVIDDYRSFLNKS